MGKEKKLNFANIHKFQVEDDRILLDIPGGAVHVIDKIIYDLLDALEEADGDWEKTAAVMNVTYSPEETVQAISEVQQLIENKELFTEDVFGALYQPPAPLLKSLCLNISHDCDLRCRYCFASTGHFGGKRALMPLEVAIGAIDFLMENSGNRKYCEVDFFGGEPLMNLDVVKATVAHGREVEKKYGKHIKFTLTTNAYGLTPEVEDWLNEAGLSVVLSHDGRPEIHDYMRMTCDGKGTHDVINENIKRFVSHRPEGNYYVRGTYTKFNKDFSRDIEHWLAQGYKVVSMEPVVSKDTPWALTEEDLEDIKAEYKKLADLYWRKKQEGKPFEFFHFNVNLNHGPCLQKRLTGCGAGYEYMAVTPEGDLYPCHQFVGRDEFKIGTIKTGVEHPEIIAKFQQAHIYNKDACKNCWARFFCSGGCHANAESSHGTLLEPYEMGCALEKCRLEYAIWLAVKGQLQEEAY